MKATYKLVNKDNRRDHLLKFLPELTVDPILDWVDQYQVNLKINKARRSKLGDYRAPFGGDGHRITINHDLNPYSFLITLVHEFAHLTTFEKFKRKRIAPHGKEWKNEFKRLMDPFMHEAIFPNDVLIAIKRYMSDPAASSCSDLHLLRILERYDEKSEGQAGMLNVEEIQEGVIFVLENGMVFKKGELLRKRFKCIEMRTKRTYFVNPLAKARLFEKQETKPKIESTKAVIHNGKPIEDTKIIETPSRQEIREPSKQLALF